MIEKIFEVVPEIRSSAGLVEIHYPDGKSIILTADAAIGTGLKLMEVAKEAAMAPAIGASARRWDRKGGAPTPSK